MTAKTKINWKKPYAVVRGGGESRYLQDGLYFDHKGDRCGDVDPQFMKKKRTVHKPAKEPQSKEDVLARAADKLDLENSQQQSHNDVRKENAAALAAEENA